MTSNLKKILIVGGILVIVAVGYLFISRSSGSEPSGSGLVATSPTTGDSRASSQIPRQISDNSDLVSLLNNLRDLTLDKSLFGNPAFESLRDISIALPPAITRGRTNPFSSLGNDPVIPLVSGQEPETPPETIAPEGLSSLEQALDEVQQETN